MNLVPNDLPDRITANLALFNAVKRNMISEEAIGNETMTRSASNVRFQKIKLNISDKLTNSTSKIENYAFNNACCCRFKNNENKTINVIFHTVIFFLRQAFNLPIRPCRDPFEGIGAMHEPNQFVLLCNQKFLS
ncbi:MAG: hypothetical protein ACFC03_02685 [Candidatus Malihini olakiniferum]